ncbi:MAG: DUF736 family protein [Pseudomonadota bacterium]|nr:DUF736 family protein [Pseudomonadota bacterium]
MTMKIGSFLEGEKGALEGHVYGLGIGTLAVRFEPQVSKDGKDYFRLIADPQHGAYEIGAAFPKEKGGICYLSVNLESPVLASPIHAALFADKDRSIHNLVWSRIDRDMPKEEPPTLRRRRQERLQAYA